MRCDLRTYCVCCGGRMIHRDRRGGHESSSALGQIVHNSGPNEITVGDLDLFVVKYLGEMVSLRGLEHKQPDQQLGLMQARALRMIDDMIQFCITHQPDGLRPLHPTSGMFVIRAQLEENNKSETLKFHGPPTISKLDGTIVSQPKNLRELNDWLNVGPNWNPRRGRGRYGGSLT